MLLKIFLRYLIQKNSSTVNTSKPFPMYNIEIVLHILNILNVLFDIVIDEW